MRLLSVVGTRPEAIKIAPIARAAAARPAIDHRLVATGQHRELFDDMAAAFGLTVDRNLALGETGQTIEALEQRIAAALPALADELRPDMILVQGDTTSAWGSALAAHRLGMAVGHVEAGLRSHDLALPFPEERNRVEIDAVSTLLFAPTATARANLEAEPAVTGRIHVTGNTGIDALLWMRGMAAGHRLHDGGRRLVLVTCHRRENIGAGIAGICEALRRLARRPDVRIVLPLHPNPSVRAGIREALAGIANIELLDPLDYPTMVRMMDGAHLILSDSGGLQEEAPALGVPLLVLRDNSERPEALATGNIALVGTDPDRIVAAATRLLDNPAAYAAMAVPAYPYGRGDAAERILDAIEDWAATFRPRASQPASGRSPPASQA
ncbi:UDP-N-acetylglucosamine 2-epimerase (non-hydrolyzing) [Sphingomonas fennica]|uniref:UDP-N-acetylglucosamine 2-epimerase (non-hydrolyzing) n=1 Tax=Edaphosphingomonas fennica TaxID=114404 RepID=A0A2T4I6Q6_9SPHN|nr:UDP-N-acetylglucosamine 2-epimerase (non-hydrolyzing) [Sphingomonas fennica]